jgi:cell wall-associated NlpC family hydrolase
LSRPRLRFLFVPCLLVCLLAVALATPGLALAKSGRAPSTSAGSGGSGIPSTPRVRRKRRRTATTHRSTATQRAGSTTNTSTNDGVTAPVKRDGGSAHHGERTLRQGMQGHDVRVLQGYLSLAGFSTPIDGSFGASTETSVVGFEAAHSLPTNGVVTYADSLVLRQAVVFAMAGGAIGTATINPDGTATAPAGAPAAVTQMIAAANQIIDKPYVWGGGHANFNASGYDCSGAVSYALHGAGLLSSPDDSSGLESFGSSGPGRWVTVYADSSHTWVVIAGIAFDTANYGGPNIPSGNGPRWRTNPTGNLADGGGYVVRHPAGL